MAFYELNEENGTSATDSSGNSNTGTYNGRVAFLKPGPFASTQPGDGAGTRALPFESYKPLRLVGLPGDARGDHGS